jgi:hypothetical protein
MGVDRRRDYGEPPQVDVGSVIPLPGTDFSDLTSRNDKSGVVDEPAAGIQSSAAKGGHSGPSLAGELTTRPPEITVPISRAPSR